MKRLYTIVIAILALFTLTACGSDKTTAKKVTQKFYTVNITDTRTKDDNWIIKGTTNAPNGSQIVGITDDSDSQMLENSSASTPTVKNGKFIATVSGVLPDDNSKAGDKVYIYIAASSPNKIVTSDDLSIKKKYISDVQNDKFEKTFKYTEDQIKYYKSLDDDSSDSDSSSSDDKDTDKSSESSSEAKQDSSKSSKSVSTEFKNALKTAKDYSDSMHMSKAGIYEQLSSDAGEQFSAAAAQYAVDNLKADYNKNALMTAKDYQDSMHMSPEEIRDQLASEAGDQFTQAEADYAVNHLND
ncbi:Ltp family lipoprotein [Pediococcus acidilactici]|uniref:Ltp family lipoprotein n=2 Tax=Lactobacillaceae TaxID=33958 RepID=UPI0013671A32|nr:Ltp family lipoprotein [Pediococcus acidilactici]QHM53364.1 hypothetical protein C7M42_00056 [Pediococcus acidilactici]